MMGRSALSSRSQPNRRRSGGLCAAKRRAFTLIELLVVVAIIALLISILLPTLRGARDQARRVSCLANLKNCGTALHVYADEHQERLPSSNVLAGRSPHLYYRYSAKPSGRYDLPELMRPYLGNMGAWGCPALHPPAIDDPANTRSERYGTYVFFPGRRQPRFGTDEPVPEALEDLSRRWPVLQDFTALYGAGGIRFQHGQGTLFVPWPDACPSYRYMLGDCDGVNILHGDMGAAWYRVDALDIVGSNNGTGDKLCLSILP